MSEHITHVGAFEDASRILLEVSDLDSLFKESLETYYDTALCASASRGNHLFAVPHLQEVRRRHRERGYVEESDRRLLASSLGWLIHRAVDHELDDAIEPQIEEIREEEGLSEEELHIDEHQIYQDAAVLRERAQVPEAGSGEHVARVASLYARSLRDGYRAVEAAGAYFAEEIGREEFLFRLG